jgi:hypothetical protein
VNLVHLPLSGTSGDTYESASCLFSTVYGRSTPAASTTFFHRLRSSSSVWEKGRIDPER